MKEFEACVVIFEHKLVFSLMPNIRYFSNEPWPSGRTLFLLFVVIVFFSSFFYGRGGLIYGRFSRTPRGQVCFEVSKLYGFDGKLLG